MMGRSGGSGERLFYSFSLEDKIPADHLLRRIDQFLDFEELRAHLKPFYSLSWSNTGVQNQRKATITGRTPKYYSTQK